MGTIINEIKVFVFILFIFFISASTQAQQKSAILLLPSDSFPESELKYSGGKYEDSFSPIKKSSKDIPSEKSPVLAGILSTLLPGTGQAYNGQWIKAAVQWTLITGSIYLTVIDINFDSESQKLPATSVVGISIGAATWIWSVIDAVISANQINNERRQIKKSKSQAFSFGKFSAAIESFDDKSDICLSMKIHF